MKKFVVIFLIFLSNLLAINIDETLQNRYILPHALVWIAPYDATLEDAQTSSNFKKYSKEHFNFGFNADVSVWIKMELLNTQKEKMEIALSIDNPLNEEVIFFEDGDGFLPHKFGMLNISKNQTWINPAYLFTLESTKPKSFYIKVSNKNTSLLFGIVAQKKDVFIWNDKVKQFMIVLCVGMLISFLIYSLVLYLYTKDISYFLYAFYLLTLMFQQLTYVGFLPLYTSTIFTYIDSLIVVPKVSIMIIAAALFAKKFLKTKKFPLLDRVYDFFIIILLIQMPIIGTEWFYIPEVTVLIGFLFVVFNTYAAWYVYAHGHIQARFFIVGWSFLIVGYLLMIADSLGLVSVMYHLPELILWITVLEALFLLLAFVDKINILDKQLLTEMSTRHAFVEDQVKQRTGELNDALRDKMLLFHELHHRVKNNLQLILSIIRLQRYDIDEDKENEQFQILEKRIEAIAKTHEMLHLSDDISQVEMKDYIGELCNEIEHGLVQSSSIQIEMDVESVMLLHQAVYVGLIVNELISNAIKYAFDEDGGFIFISLKEEEGNYILNVRDTGKSHMEKEKSENALGLKLVNLLVLHQLEGTIDVKANGAFEYNIVFPMEGSGE